MRLVLSNFTGCQGGSRPLAGHCAGEPTLSRVGIRLATLLAK